MEDREKEKQIEHLERLIVHNLNVLEVYPDHPRQAMIEQHLINLEEQYRELTGVYYTNRK